MSRNTMSTAERTLPVDKSTRSGLKLVTRERALFKDSLLDSSVERKRRTWTTLVSIVLQSFLIGILIVVPLWFTEELPRQQLLTLLEAPPPPPPPPPPPAASPASAPKSVKVTSNIVEAHLRTPSRIPSKVQMIKEDAAVPPAGIAGGVIGGVPGGTPGGQLDGVIGGIIGSASNFVPKVSKPAPQPTVQRVRVSQGVTKGLLVSRVEPSYPTVAHEARVQGVVVLTAIIGKDGNVERLQLESGNPLLVQAAIDAVKQWRYKPFLLNGQPVEIETTITVNFQLHSG